MKLRRKGAEIHYEVFGKGPAIVFAHGLGGNHLSWWQQVAHFADHRARVIDPVSRRLLVPERETEVDQEAVVAANAAAAGPMSQAAKDQEVLAAQELVAQRRASLTERELDTEGAPDARDDLRPFLVQELGACRHAQALGRAMIDEHADAAPNGDEPVFLEGLIGLGDRQRIGALIGGEGADGSRLVAFSLHRRAGRRPGRSGCPGGWRFRACLGSLCGRCPGGRGVAYRGAARTLSPRPPLPRKRGKGGEHQAWSRARSAPLPPLAGGGAGGGGDYARQRGSQTVPKASHRARFPKSWAEGDPRASDGAAPLLRPECAGHDGPGGLRRPPPGLAASLLRLLLPFDGHERGL